MLWVGGGIIVHGLEHFHLTPIPHWVEGLSHWAGAVPAIGPVTAWLAMAASFVVGIALFLVAASLALILIPIVAVAGAIAIWRLKAKMKAAGFDQADPFAHGPQQTGRVEVIDAEYRIIEPDEPRR